MEKLRFYCKCGYATEQLGSLNDLEEIVICPLCDTPMNLEDDLKEAEGVISMKELGRIIVINDMLRQILSSGHNKTWERIENLFIDPIQRLRYRKIFFEAGGVAPESEI